MTARWYTFDLVSIAAPYPSGNQPFILQPRKAASAPRLHTIRITIRKKVEHAIALGSQMVVHGVGHAAKPNRRPPQSSVR